MEYAKKMVILPRETVEKLKNVQLSDTVVNSVQTPGTELSRVDSEMSKILNSNSINDDNTKWKLYEQALQRFLRFNESNHIRKEEIIPEESHTNSLTDNTILESIPSKFRNKAKLLLLKLRNTPDNLISWDNNGIVTINGVVIQRSNIIDLINESMRFRKSFDLPGREKFSRLLHEISVPREYVGNTNLWEVGLNNVSSTPLVDDFEEIKESTNEKSVEKIFNQKKRKSSSPVKAIHKKKKRAPISKEEIKKIISEYPINKLTSKKNIRDPYNFRAFSWRKINLL